MIHETYIEYFKSLEPKYTQYKDKVKSYIENRYINASKNPISVFSVCVGFQMVIADIPQGVLTLWLEEWGYRVETSKGTDEHHNVYLKPKPLLTPTEEDHYRKTWIPRKKGFIVY